VQSADTDRSIRVALSTTFSHRGYPSEVLRCNYGYCLVATKDLPAGIIVEKFEGPIISNELITAESIRYAIIWDNNSMLDPNTPARYANHSCDPNSYVNDFLEIATSRPVKRGEEITYSYNWIYEGRQDATWDDRWTFHCKCGSPRCQGLINKYVPYPSSNH
jgi:hypothetical protein